MKHDESLKYYANCVPIYGSARHCWISGPILTLNKFHFHLILLQLLNNSMAGLKHSVSTGML